MYANASCRWLPVAYTLGGITAIAVKCVQPMAVRHNDCSSPIENGSRLHRLPILMFCCLLRTMPTGGRERGAPLSVFESRGERVLTAAVQYMPAA